MITSTYKKGEVICWEGDSGRCMYYIVDGSVGVYSNYAKRSERQLAVLWRGDYFGEMGLIDNSPRSATVVVLERDTVLQRIDVEEFKEFLAENPRKVNDILIQLAHKLRNITREYLEVCKVLNEKVGGASEVDESSSLGLAGDDRLVSIHDKVQEDDARRMA